MLHYDMIRYEIMYLKTLDRLFNKDHSLLCSIYDAPAQYRSLITQILERRFLGDQSKLRGKHLKNGPTCN